jgi:RNA polymerase sigma-70 factor (ECF subfamily)
VLEWSNKDFARRSPCRKMPWRCVKRGKALLQNKLEQEGYGR